MILAAAATTAVIGVIRTTRGPRDKDRRIVEEVGCATLTTVGATAGEIAMTNGGAVMVAEPVLSRCQMLMRRKAKVEGGIRVTPMGSLTVGVAGVRMETPFPRLSCRVPKYKRTPPLLSNRPSGVPISNGQKDPINVSLRAEENGRIKA